MFYALVEARWAYLISYNKVRFRSAKPLEHLKTAFAEANDFSPGTFSGFCNDHGDAFDQPHAEAKAEALDAAPARPATSTYTVTATGIPLGVPATSILTALKTIWDQSPTPLLAGGEAGFLEASFTVPSIEIAQSFTRSPLTYGTSFWSFRCGRTATNEPIKTMIQDLARLTASLLEDGPDPSPADQDGDNDHDAEMR